MELYRLNELEQQISDDVDWGEASPEVQQHAGKLVAIRKKRILGVGTDWQVLRRQAAEQEGCDEHEVVILIVHPDDLSEIPH
jgi:hypothetical protein